MNQSTHNTSLLRRAITLIRGCLVAFLMLPGTGFALVAAACGDLGESPAVSADAQIGTMDASESASLAPLAPHVTERTKAPATPTPLSPTLLPLGEPLPVVEVAPELPAEGPTSLAVVESALAHGVSKRRPVRPATEFMVGDVAWAWVSVKNTGDAQPATMVWSRDGQVRSRLTLEIGTSARWRTWSRRTLRSADVGAWRVEVQDQRGDVIHTLTFEVVPVDQEVTATEYALEGC